MIIHSAEVVKYWHKVGTYVNKAGQVKDSVVPIVLGVRAKIDDVVVFVSAKHHTFSVTYPEKDTLNKALQKIGTEKGTKFSGMTQAQFLREYGPKFVKTVKEAFQRAIAENG